MIPRSQVFRFVIALLVAICVSFVLLRQIETGLIPETIQRISPSAMLIGFVLYCIFILSKTIRFRQLLAINQSTLKLLPIFALHTFWGNILPFRSGDLSYIFLMKSQEQVTGTKSLASLMLASIIDLTLLIGLISMTSLLLRSDLAGLSYFGLLVLPIFFGISILGFMGSALFARKKLNCLINTFENWVQYFNFRLIQWITAKILAIIKELLSTNLDRHFLLTWVYSIISMTIRFGFQIYLIVEMGVEVPIINLIFALVFTNIFNLLPIQSIGNFGTIEAPFSWALIHFGTTKEVALVTAFSLHIIILAYCLPIGLYGLISRRRTEA